LPLECLEGALFEKAKDVIAMTFNPFLFASMAISMGTAFLPEFERTMNASPG